MQAMQHRCERSDISNLRISRLFCYYSLMVSNRRCWSLLGSVLLSVASQAEASSATVLSLHVEKTSTSAVIRFTLTNVSPAPVIVGRAFLPWRQANAKAAAIEESSEKALGRAFILDAAPPGRIELPSGGSISEDVDLTAWFPSIRGVLERDNVVVYFAADVRTASPVSTIASI